MRAPVGLRNTRAVREKLCTCMRHPSGMTRAGSSDIGIHGSGAWSAWPDQYPSPRPWALREPLVSVLTLFPMDGRMGGTGAHRCIRKSAREHTICACVQRGEGGYGASKKGGKNPPTEQGKDHGGKYTPHDEAAERRRRRTPGVGANRYRYICKRGSRLQPRVRRAYAGPLAST